MDLLSSILKFIGNKLTTIEDKSITITTTISASNAVSDTTYSSYPYRIDLAISKATVDHVPNVYPQKVVDDVSFFYMTSSNAGIVSCWVSNNTFADIPAVVILTK